MFKWYQKSDKCYVLLSWFRCGRMLQELLAPKSVDLLSQNRQWLGIKESLLQALHSATRITILALQNNALSQLGVNERMSWTEGRETKREEDGAYSLLGTFDVHMPLIYGEGQPNAFARLRRKIERPQRSRPLIEPPPPRPSSWTVFFRHDDDFVDRNCVEKLCKICAQPAGCASLVGLGGIG
ncbi:het domain protein [Stagonosporopsis vannaccii]|nr:het domain protein [Stagonosporopsis vannaccii]